MLVAYCVECLPAKIVLGFGHLSEIKTPHQGHPKLKRPGFFPISYKGWQQVFVEGDEAKTKENIVVQFGSEFV